MSSRRAARATAVAEERLGEGLGVDLAVAQPVDGGAEVVGGDDKMLQAAASRWRKNLKNSTPSRNRRFIISGLRTISPTIDAIFGARK